jgi:hypothetical protein
MRGKLTLRCRTEKRCTGMCVVRMYRPKHVDDTSYSYRRLFGVAFSVAGFDAMHIV